MRGFGWRPYVPVHVRRNRAQRELAAMRKQGMNPEPVEIAGRVIARTFWGASWCRHLEGFSDYSNRLPRGRTYVRNGSVCHLDIQKGVVSALVSGSSLYTVRIGFKKLPLKKWSQVKGRCAGEIGSLLELLAGKLSENVMGVITDRHEGLYPLPGEIEMSCSCPDWATMCKHVAAVLYGVGARLDEKPELLFLLRGVDQEELVTAGVGRIGEGDGAGKHTSQRTASGRGKRLSPDRLADVFGVEIEEAELEQGGAVEEVPSAKHTRTARRAKKTSGSGSRRGSGGRSGSRSRRGSRTRTPVAPTARQVRTLRGRFSMTQVEFARLLGVSAVTVGTWERGRGRLSLRPASLDAWHQVAKLSARAAHRRLRAME